MSCTLDAVTIYLLSVLRNVPLSWTRECQIPIRASKAQEWKHVTLQVLMDCYFCHPSLLALVSWVMEYSNIWRVAASTRLF